MSDPLPPGAPGSRTHYSFTITAREREAVQRFINIRMVQGDHALLRGVLVKIAAEQEKVVDDLPAEGVKAKS